MDECNETHVYLLDGGNLTSPSPWHQSGSCPDVPDPKFPIYIQATATAFCVGILAFGSLGNILVPAVVLRTKELRNATNIFLINLSVADLLVLLVCMPTVLIELHSRPEVWLLGEVMCKLVPFVELFSAHASILTILAISLERYVAICQPLKASYIFTRRVNCMAILFVWIVAAAVTSPVLSISEYKETQYVDGSTVYVCITSAQSPWQKVYFALVTILLFLIPLVLLTAMYCVISRQLMMDTGLLKSSIEKKQLKTRKQVVIMLATVVGCFFICLLPFRILTIWIIAVPTETVHSLGVERFYNLLYFCRIMLYINSAVNPILYNLISSKFRKGFSQLLCCCRSRPLSVLRRHTTFSSTVRSSLYGAGSFFAHTPSNNHHHKKCFDVTDKSRENFV